MPLRKDVKASGEVKRKIIKSVPEEVTYDIVHPSCGHSQPYLLHVREEEKEEISLYVDKTP